MPTWKRIEDRGAGFLYDLSESLALLDWRSPGVLEPVTSGLMIIVSDYSGQHKQASHEAYSFLITTDYALEEWFPVLRDFRSRWLADGRRISFKQLSEPVRWRALMPFLGAASALRGNVITFLVDRRIESFIDGGAEALAEAFPECFSQKTKPATAEKMFRLSGFVALLIAGLRKEDQSSLWISDHDEALETFHRREQFAQLSQYLTFGLTQWRKPEVMEFATTESPQLPLWAEDAASIPDLIAGACCKLSSVLPTYCGKENWIRTVSSRAVEDRRAGVVGNWMATTHDLLKHVLLRLELDNDGVPRTSAQCFAGVLPSTGIQI